MRRGAHSTVTTPGSGASVGRMRGQDEGSIPLFPCLWASGLTTGQGFFWGQGANETPQAVEQGMGSRAILFQASGEKTNEKLSRQEREKREKMGQMVQAARLESAHFSVAPREPLLSANNSGVLMSSSGLPRPAPQPLASITRGVAPPAMWIPPSASHRFNWS